MSADSGAARIAGVLYLLGMAAGMLSVAPSVDAQDYLIMAAANEAQVMRAALAQLAMAPAWVGVAVVLYPVLKKHGETLALGFLGFTIIAGALIFAGAIVLLMVLNVSRDFVGSGAPAVSYLQTLGAQLRSGRDLVNHVGMILALSFGALSYYSLLFRAKLVPRWLSAWGLIGAVLTAGASLLIMFRLLDVLTTTYVALNAPLALQETVLSIWLIARGLGPAAPDGSSR